MRLLVYLNLRRDEFVTQYFEDRHHMLELLTFNCFGNLVVQYIFIEDRKVFYRYEDYKKYVDRKLRKGQNKRYGLKYMLGNAFIDLGYRLAYGKRSKTTPQVVYKYVIPWWYR